MNRHNWDLSGLALVLRCIATGIILLFLLALLGEIFPAQRSTIWAVAPVVVGVGVGFVYGCMVGPAAWLFVFAWIFSSVVWLKNEALNRNLAFFGVYLILFYVGFGISCLFGCRRITS